MKARRAPGAGSDVRTAGRPARDRQTKEHSLLPAWKRCQSLGTHPGPGRRLSQMGSRETGQQSSPIYSFKQS